ncbi:hypothetical protein METBIDRAFT_11785 [Metschnikowia bicuspidata var. bicuspidata NRRL YB-4993]|uniref:Uncharacterized protein n=1 Tax=Metschnikowia bicuspidata var. bicuspidata NRRL YB-4993 TaxID=869754 RepID=A0A1A0HBG5_9ASCO|nr:hypothetical protein METBIDRAFT_11785 [Metschnikowia bicuspidata var. bicuspidata NRRL YB-4993]OBA21228.1 hypothetical protein METBIDRAFT_11785 [Metschnikowia bicuspidata var. bicuspidata NRRL YB-4993]
MSDSGFLSDPAIIGLSSPTEIPRADTNPKNLGFEPGSALSKLLDSAVANAAKEVTPEPESDGNLKHGGQQQPRSKRSSIQNFVPTEKTDHSRIYSINYLLDLRSSPAVLDFDATRLPEFSFWRYKSKDGTKNHNQDNSHNNHSNNAPSGTGKRNRRNKDSANTGASDTLNWGRKPAGFLKESDIDKMSKEKISQLLGEPHEEETPDWDLPGSNVELEMGMGSTVEDFERWKLHMRQEERRRNGGPEAVGEIADLAPSNEVDSFFSFARPKEPVTENSSSSVKKQAENQSSRFSSFFGGPAPAPEGRTHSTGESENSNSSRKSLKDDHSGGSLRFFKGNFHAQSASHPQSPEELQRLQERMSHGPPPGIHSKFQTHNGVPHPPSLGATNSMPPHPNPPPGFHMNAGPPLGLGMMMGPGPRGLPNNDSFFLSLLNKREIGPAPEGSAPIAMGTYPPQATKSAESKQFERPPSFGIHVSGQDAYREPSFSGPSTPNAQQVKPPQYIPYQDMARGMSQPQVGMKPPPGMKPFPGTQLPQGMFPPGMFPPGAQAPNQRAPTSLQTLSLQAQQNPMHQNGQGVPKPPMRGEMPPPWMGFGPNVPEGMVPPGFNHMPHGFPPGFPHPPPPNNHQQTQEQSQQK